MLIRGGSREATPFYTAITYVREWPTITWVTSRNVLVNHIYLLHRKHYWRTSKVASNDDAIITLQSWLLQCRLYLNRYCDKRKTSTTSGDTASQYSCPEEPYAVCPSSKQPSWAGSTLSASFRFLPSCLCHAISIYYNSAKRHLTVLIQVARESSPVQSQQFIFPFHLG